MARAQNYQLTQSFLKKNHKKNQRNKLKSQHNKNQLPSKLKNQHQTQQLKQNYDKQ